MKKTNIIGVLTVLIGLLATSCGKEKGRPTHDVAQYKTMVVSQKDMKLERHYSARITEIGRAHV